MNLRRSAVRLAGGLVTASGTAALLRRQRRQRDDFRVFILEYHEVTDGSNETEGVISARRFRQHLRYLKRHFRLASLHDAVSLLAESRALREDLVVVTFDDGYASNYECAWRVLREEQIPAAVFVTTGFLDGHDLWFDLARRGFETARYNGTRLPADLERELRAALGHWPLLQPVGAAVEHLKRLPPAVRGPMLRQLERACTPQAPAARPLSWGQVREMLSGGIEIGCHTVSHPILSTLPVSEQQAEITRSRDRIAEETGVTPILFAYPNGAAGDFDEGTVRIVREAGFAAACTTVRGSNRPGCDPFTLRRIGVGAEPCFVLAARLAGVFDEGVRARVRWLAGNGKRRLAETWPVALQCQESLGACPQFMAYDGS